MKKIIVIIALLAINITGYADMPKAEKLGLIAELAYNKHVAEAYMAKALHDPAYVQDAADFRDLLDRYNAVRLLTDQLILQIEADCKRKNRLKAYKKLDDALTESSVTSITSAGYDGKLRAYIDLLKKINTEVLALEQAYKAHYAKVAKAGVYKGLTDFVDFTGLPSLLNDVIRAAADAREKKVDKISEILEGLRVAPISLTGAEEEEKK